MSDTTEDDDRAMYIRAFCLPLPLDGGHEDVVEAARGQGMLWSQEEADDIVNKAKEHESIGAVLTYVWEVPNDPTHQLPLVIRRLEACARLRRDGLGDVPTCGKPKLQRMREFAQQLADAITDLLGDGGIR